MPVDKIPSAGIESGGVAPSNLSTGAPSWSSTGFLTSQINSATAGQYAPLYFYRLDSGLAGANVNTAQSVLGVGVTLSSSTVYAFEAEYAFSKSAGATNHNFQNNFGGTATLNNINYRVSASFSGTSLTTAPPTSVNGNFIMMYPQVATATTLIAGIASAGSYVIINVKGTVSINAGGTFIPQYTLSAAPGGAYTTAAGSYFLIYPIGVSGANTNIGGWA